MVGIGMAYGEAANRIMAIVNNEIITFYELEKAIKNLPPSTQETENKEELQKQLLFQLIEQKLVDVQVKRLGIQISADEVEKTLARIKQDNGITGPDDFAAVLTKEGISEAEFRNKIKEQILRFRLISREIGSKIIIPEVRIQEYYQNNKSKFQRSEGIHLAHILLINDQNTSPEESMRQKKKAEEIWERLKGGEDFADQARKFSQDSSAAQGGDLGLFSVEELDPSLWEILSTLKAGEFSPVLQSSQGWQIIKVVEVQRAKEFSLDEVKERIQEQLFQEEVNQRFTQWLQRIKDRSYIQVFL